MTHLIAAPTSNDKASPVEDPIVDRRWLLAGAFVQRADVGARGLIIKVRAPGETAYIVLIPQGLALSKDRPLAPDDARRRKDLEGARVAWLAPRRLVLWTPPGKDGAPRFVRLALQGSGDASRVTVERELGEPRAEVDALDVSAREAISSGGVRLREVLVASALVARKATGARAVKRAIARLERRIAAVEGDLERIASAATVAARAPWLIAAAAEAPRGARQLKVTDWSSGEPRELVVPLDPAKPARLQVEAMFARARRLKLGEAVARERQTRAGDAVRNLTETLALLERAADLPAVDEALTAARAAAPKDVSIAVDPVGEGSSRATNARGAHAKLPPFRTFTSASGRTILVGKGASQNDLLTFHVAKPGDLWLHAKGRNGAHVIVPRAARSPAKTRELTFAPSGDLLVEAAHLAAHFSDARDEALVEVQYTERRYLRKPRGSVAGLVVVQRENVLGLRVDTARVKALLEREVIASR